MLKISDVSISLDETNYAKVIANSLNLRITQVKNVKIIKKAVDARRKNNIHFNCAFSFEVENEDFVLNRNPKKKLARVKPYHYDPLVSTQDTVLVVGSGPAGLFCAYNLARSGQKVHLIEQGKKVEERKQDIDDFLETGKLNTLSNVQFGEGGAGTFSDGKLTTGVKDFRKQFVLETFVRFGAHDDILYMNKPHIGTDVLMKVVKNMRNEIIALGGQVDFETELVDIVVENNQYKQAIVSQKGKQYVISTDCLVLAIGHSSRKTYEMLYRRGVPMTQKPFAVGMRIEHSQDFINEHQYGRMKDHPALQAADYKLAVHTSLKRGVYTFCMCPGGYVMNASSEEGQVCVNGMSYNLRDSQYANSAILVTVDEYDFNDSHPLAGMYFQRELEKKAFELGGYDYSVPIQRVEDYIDNRFNDDDIETSVQRTKVVNLNELFNESLNINLKEGLLLMNKKISHFTENATLLGVEARSSAPVRFERNVNMECPIQGIYPIGEGAGYAGGIMSSAIDGLKCSEKIVKGE